MIASNNHNLMITNRIVRISNSVRNLTSLDARHLIHPILRMNVPQLVNPVILGMVNTAALMPVHVIFALPRREGILGCRGMVLVHFGCIFISKQNCYIIG